MFRKAALILMICCISLPAMANDPQAEEKELAESIRQFHSTRDCEGFMKLFYDNDTDRERHLAFYQTITVYVCNNFGRKITSIAFQDIDADKLAPPKDFQGKPSEYTLKPIGAVVIAYENRSVPEAATDITLLYGEQDGKYYLLTTRQAQAATK